MECEHCHKNLSTKSALRVHQQKAKYCLKIQGKSNEGDFSCNFCEKNFTVKSSRDDHHNICSANSKSILDLKNNLYKSLEQNKVLEKEIEILRKEKNKIQKLYSELAKISAKKSTGTNS